jgi:8-oxo-dGTP pyrophosphatase MutT (NUDIX family)
MMQLRSAKALIVDADDNVLVLRRSATHPYAPHRSDLPGGVVEDGESLVVGIVREILEEIGYEVLPDALQEVDVYKHVMEQLEGEMERALYLLRLPEGRPVVVLSWEHDQYNWIPLIELKDIEAPVQKQIDNVIKAKLY